MHGRLRSVHVEIGTLAFSIANHVYQRDWAIGPLHGPPLASTQHQTQPMAHYEASEVSCCGRAICHARCQAKISGIAVTSRQTDSFVA